MKNGAFDEGEATLRLKITLADSKQDPVSLNKHIIQHNLPGIRLPIE